MKHAPSLRASLAALGLAALAATAQPSRASELVYTPVNPSFGGSPLNGATLMSAAQAQNKTKDPDSPQAKGLNASSPVQQFNEMLERSILNRLAAAATAEIIGPNGQLIPGTVTTANYVIDIADLGGGVLQITTTDIATNKSTSFQIGGQ